ncbi:YlbF family regulator [Natronomonas sp.]|uniref:YlbF family regulator n=1 Tax=Natronomonas sp. TaxID=2184060 RepID=UPI002635A1D0|nr:YlbF family regulator [Natronomonas sp.]
MSVETTPRERATELATELGDAIAELDVYDAFLEAKATVEADEELQQEMAEFERLREEFLMAREAGTASNEDLLELQNAQEELHSDPKMSAYLEAKSELELRLQELDQLVSEPLDVEFGETAGGCCQE